MNSWSWRRKRACTARSRAIHWRVPTTHWRTCARDACKARRFVGILDLWHALTYLWLAAKVFHGAKLAREAFVTARLRMLLEGKVGRSEERRGGKKWRNR